MMAFIIRTIWWYSSLNNQQAYRRLLILPRFTRQSPYMRLMAHVGVFYA